MNRNLKNFIISALLIISVIANVILFLRQSRYRSWYAEASCSSFVDVKVEDLIKYPAVGEVFEEPDLSGGSKVLLKVKDFWGNPFNSQCVLAVDSGVVVSVEFSEF